MQRLTAQINLLALPSYALGAETRTKTTDMAIVMMIALFSGAMYLLYRMVYGFTEMLSNAKKMKR